MAAVCLCASGPRPPSSFLTPESRVWILTSRNGFCCGQRHSVWDSQNCRGSRTHTDKSCNCLVFIHGLSKGTSVFSRSHFPFVHPHSLSNTTWTLLWTENRTHGFHFWPSFSFPVVHLHLFGVSFSLCCSSALWQKICFSFFSFTQTLTCFSIYACLSFSHFQWKLEGSDLFLHLCLSFFFTLPVKVGDFPCPEWQPLWWCDKVQFYANQKQCNAATTNGNADSHTTDTDGYCSGAGTPTNNSSNMSLRD